MDENAAQGLEITAEIKALQQRGMLVRTAPRRWRVCTAVSQWILASLRDEDIQRCERIHSDWSVQLAHTAAATQDMLSLIREQDNLLAASMRAADRLDAEAAGITSVGLILGLHWMGPPAAALTVANRALALEDLSPRLRVQILRLRALSQHFLGHLDDATSDLHEAVVLLSLIHI